MARISFPSPTSVRMAAANGRASLATDFGCAVTRCEALPDGGRESDAIILAGDISDNQETFRATVQVFRKKYKHVFFVPGNHDLWVRRKERDVLDSLGAQCTGWGVLHPSWPHH